MTTSAPEPLVKLAFLDSEERLQLSVGEQSVSIPYSALGEGVRVGGARGVLDPLELFGELSLTVLYDELLHVTSPMGVTS